MLWARSIIMTLQLVLLHTFKTLEIPNYFLSTLFQTLFQLWEVCLYKKSTQSPQELHWTSLQTEDNNNTNWLIQHHGFLSLYDIFCYTKGLTYFTKFQLILLHTCTTLRLSKYRLYSISQTQLNVLNTNFTSNRFFNFTKNLIRRMQYFFFASRNTYY